MYFLLEQHIFKCIFPVVQHIFKCIFLLAQHIFKYFVHKTGKRRDSVPTGLVACVSEICLSASAKNTDLPLDLPVQEDSLKLNTTLTKSSNYPAHVS
jgi:hypothetical protein